MMRLLFCFLMMSCSIVCKGQLEQLRNGDLLFQRAYYHEALTAYNKYLKIYPKDASTQLKVAKCYLALFDEVSAEKPLFTAFKLSRRISYEMYFTRGVYYQFKHEYTLALIDFRQVPVLGNPEVKKRIEECEAGQQLIKKPIKIELINLKEPINSDKNEFLPKVTADNKQMFFSSYREGALGGKHPMDIYFVKKENDKWGDVNALDSSINSVYNEACVGLSADGHQMYLYRGSNGGDLFISDFKGGKWQESVAFPFNTKAKESSMTISPDGQCLLFIRKQKGESSMLYVSYLGQDSTWSEPKLFELNSSYDDETPFFHADGKTLYFSSKRKGTIGGFDIFSTKKEDGYWSDPQNVGYPLNTAKDELGFVLTANGQHAYYSSLREFGIGQQDIYEIKLPNNFLTPQMVLLSGVVTDEHQKPIESTLVIVDLKTQNNVTTIYSNAKDGAYLLPLECGKEYGIRVEKKGYLFHSSYVFIQSGYIENVHDIVLTKDLKAQKTVLNNVFFATGKSELDNKSTNELLVLVDLLTENPNLNIKLSGHTDNVGKEEKNVLLSEKRVEQVKLFLENQGVDPKRIETIGVGSSEPLASNKTKEGRAKNRRIEFELFEK